MRPRSVQTSTPSRTKKSRASYGEGSQPVKEKSGQSVREAPVENQRNAEKTSAKTSPGKISSEKIAERAYSIWEREGRPNGHDNEFWFRAEAELKKEQAAQIKF